MKNSTLWQVSEVKVSYQNLIRSADRPKVNSSGEAEKVFRSMWSDDIELCEEFNVLLLSRASHVKGIVRLARGGSTGIVVDLKILFAAAIKGLATAIIIAHNHPSGTLSPSKSDIELTTQICQIGKILDIKVLDHLILAPHEDYYSFSDNGKLNSY